MKNITNQQLLQFVSWYTAMAHAVRCANRAFHEGTPLGLTQARILTYFAMFPESRMSAVSDDLILRRSTVSAAVDAMTELGLATRTRDAADSRIIHGALTDEGNKVLPTYLDVWCKVFRQLETWTTPGRLGELAELIFAAAPTGEGDESHWLAPAVDAERIQALLDEQPADYPSSMAAWFGAMEKIICVYNRIQFVAKAYNLGTNLGLILSYLELSGGQTPLSDIRGHLRLESGELTVCLDKLQRKGYIRRIIDKSDRRRVFVRITKSGSLLINECAQESVDVFQAAFPEMIEIDPVGFLRLPE